jgi:hypothetical protein
VQTYPVRWPLVRACLEQLSACTSLTSLPSTPHCVPCARGCHLSILYTPCPSSVCSTERGVLERRAPLPHGRQCLHSLVLYALCMLPYSVGGKGHWCTRSRGVGSFRRTPGSCHVYTAEHVYRGSAWPSVAVHTSSQPPVLGYAPRISPFHLCCPLSFASGTSFRFILKQQECASLPRPLCSSPPSR